MKEVNMNKFRIIDTWQRTPLAMRCTLLVCATAILITIVLCWHNRYVVAISDGSSYEAARVKLYNRWTGNIKMSTLLIVGDKRCISTIEEN